MIILGLEKFAEYCCFFDTFGKNIMRYQNFQSGISMFERMMAFCVTLILSVTPTACATAGDTAASKPGNDLWMVVEMLKSHRFVDLTHAFDGNIPHGPGFQPARRTTLFHYDEGVGTVGSGGLLHEYTHVGQWGTHVDPPAHFIRGLRYLDQISVREMVLPLVVIDIHDHVEKNPDYCVSMRDVSAWEADHGMVPTEAFVALRTDWSKRWTDAKRFYNRDADGIAHYPGWSREVLQYLYEERGITALGHETPDTDPGIAASRGDYSLETYVLSQNHYQIEMLTNLDQLPPAGAIIIASWPKPREGSGFPARVFAIVP